MSILTVYDALQAVHRSTTGIKKASERMPASLNTDDLPFAHLRVGPGEWTRVSDWSQHFRTFEVTVFVKPVAQGTAVDDGLKVSGRLLQALGEKYLSDITLGGAVQHMGRGARYDPPTVDDDGVMVYEYAGTAYWGFTYRVTVKEQILSS
jgi:hypothetical protein